MAWPQSQDYNEAIQSPKTAFKDPELAQGQAHTNALGMPLPCSGNFADVYQMNCPQTKSRWAVKCFTRGDPQALKQRYAEIDKHLQQAKLPFTVGFRFLEEGMRVRGQWHPVLKMQWVEGFTLNHFVRDNLDKPAVLDALLQIWVRLAKRLREADLAHADLQHGNVLLVPGTTAGALGVKLIDYDGMWVPALAGKKSGEVGHPAYQHTQRLYKGTYSKEVDRFPLLVVATALRCLRVAGKPLWEQFDNGDNLLFREADLAAPERSPLFEELAKIKDAQAELLVNAVRAATSRPLEEAPHLDELLSETPPGKKAPAPKGKTAPVPQAAFADLESPARPRRRDQSAASGKQWALIGGGAAAVLLCVVLIAALSGGKGKDQDKDNPDTKPEVVRVEPRKDGKSTTTKPPTQTTKPTPPPTPPPQLVIAELPALELAPGSFKKFDIQVNGVNGAAGFDVTLSDLPTGVSGKKEASDARTGKTQWVLVVNADVPPGDKQLTVTASAGEARIQGKLRLVVTARPSPPADPTLEKVRKAKADYAETLGKTKAALAPAFEQAEKDIQADEKLKPEERTAQLEQLRAQKKAFTESGRLPLSPRVKETLAPLDRAEDELKKVYEEAVAAYTQPDDRRKAEALRAEQQILGRWSVKIGPEYRTEWRFFGDGTLTSTHGYAAGKWSVERQGEGQRLLVSWDDQGKVWEALPLPLDPKKPTGDTGTNKDWRVELERPVDKPPVPIPTPDPSTLRKEQFATALRNTRTDYNAAVRKAVADHKQNVQAALDEATKAGSLDAALVLRDDIKVLETDGTPLFSDKGEAPPVLPKWVPGVWSGKYHPTKSNITIMVRANGDVLDQKGARMGRLRPRGQSFVVEPPGEKPERFTFAGSRLFIEQFANQGDLDKTAWAQIAPCDYQRAVPAASESKPSAALVQSRKDYTAAVTKAQTDYNTAVNSQVAEHKKRLQTLIEDESKAGNLNTALALREELKAPETASPFLFGVQGETMPKRVVAGTWNVRYIGFTQTFVFDFHANGEVTENGKKRGQLKLLGNPTAMEIPEHNLLERYTFVGGRMFVEQYRNVTDFRTNTLLVPGIGELAKK